MNKIFEDGVELSNGIKVNSFHVQDCCENVYADWDALKDTTFDVDEFDDVKIEKVKEAGFRINGYFVPCYNIQNGYYNDELELIIRYNNGQEVIINITSCNQNEIDG